MATLLTKSVCPFNVDLHSPDCLSQTLHKKVQSSNDYTKLTLVVTHLIVLSSDPEIRLSLVTATSLTVPVCPSNVDVRAGQSCSFVSSLAFGLGNTPAACLATRLLVGASTAS